MSWNIWNMWYTDEFMKEHHDMMNQILHDQRKTILDYIAEHPDVTGYAVGLAYQSQWGVIHTAAMLNFLSVNGYLHREENKEARTYRYHRTDKPFVDSEAQ